MNMNTRIRELRKTLKMSQREFGSHIGIRSSSLSDIENENCNVTERIVIAVCAKFHVNEEWLRCGKGNMFIEEDKKFDEFYEIYKQLSKPLQDFLIQVCKDLLDTQSKL